MKWRDDGVDKRTIKSMPINSCMDREREREMQCTCNLHVCLLYFIFIFITVVRRPICPNVFI